MASEQQFVQGGTRPLAPSQLIPAPACPVPRSESGCCSCGPTRCGCAARACPVRWCRWMQVRWWPGEERPGEERPAEGGQTPAYLAPYLVRPSRRPARPPAVRLPDTTGPCPAPCPDWRRQRFATHTDSPSSCAGTRPVCLLDLYVPVPSNCHAPVHAVRPQLLAGPAVRHGD